MAPRDVIPLSSHNAPPRDWLAAALWSMLLSCMFICVYSACLWITDNRQDVTSVFFGWEWGIPFIAWMIIPYVSIDLFFVAAPFVCANERELSTLVRRLTFVILTAGVCFLLFPLRMGFERPIVEGFFAGWYELLNNLDRPYNLVPSLHIAQWAVLWTVYGRHTRGALRLAVLGWFTLIAASTLLTWQHHVIDIIAGQALGLLAIYLFREGGDETKVDAAPVTRNILMGLRFAVVAAALAVVGWLLRPWGILLLWPAISLGAGALAYVSLGPAIFRKENGSIDAATRCVLAPYLIGSWLTFPHYRRHSPAWAQVTENLIIGRRLSDAEARRLIREGITAVLDLTAECAAAREFAPLAYRNVPVLDLTVPTPSQFRAGVGFIREQVGGGGKVYVHCALGYSRSASVVAAYLLVEGRAATAAEAVAQVAAARPQILVSDCALQAIEAFARQRGGDADHGSAVRRRVLSAAFT
jgi:hypothetical protein